MIRLTTKQLIEHNTNDLNEINKQRRLWLYASSIAVISVILLIFGWDWLDHFHSTILWWAITSVILILSVNWWYWTMRVMLRLINHQKIEFQIIAELLIDIKDIKEEVRQLGNQSVDKSK